MGPETVMLIKLLTDVILTASATLRRVHQMTEEETRAAITEAEETTRTLLERLAQSGNQDVPPPPSDPQ